MTMEGTSQLGIESRSKFERKKCLTSSSYSSGKINEAFATKDRFIKVDRPFNQ